MEKERMKLVIEGNAVYEVDQECMDRGLNQSGKRESADGGRRDMDSRFRYPYRNNKNR